MQDTTRLVTPDEIQSFMSALRAHTGRTSSIRWSFDVYDELKKLSSDPRGDINFESAVAGQLTTLSTSLIKHLNSTTSMVRQYIMKTNASITVLDLPNCSQMSWNYFKYTDYARFLPKITDFTLGIQQVIESSNAFDALIKVVNMNFPNLIQMPPWGCTDCKSLISISLPECLSIGAGAFGICYRLSSAYTPKVNYIGEQAFALCSHLSEFNTNASTITLGSSAFTGNTTLKAFNASNANILSFNGFEFEDCNALIDFTIPLSAKITFADNCQNTFSGCLNMPQNTFNTILNHLYSTESLVIHSGFFKNLQLISYISFPSAVYSIQQGAFSGCTALSKVTFGSNLAYIDSSVFTNDVNLQEINLIAVPGSVHIGANTFPDAASLPSTFKIYVQDSWVTPYTTTAEYNWIPWRSYIYGSSQYTLTPTPALAAASVGFFATAANAIKNYFVLSE